VNVCKKGLFILFLGMFVPAIGSAETLTENQEPERIDNAISVYQEILANINQEEQLRIQKGRSLAPVAASRKSEIQEFIDEIRFEIQESIQYPPALEGKGYRAIVYVEFELNRDGTIRSLRARGKNGEALSVFEAGAETAVKRAVQFFPIIPTKLNVNNMRFKIPIIFEEV